MIHSYMPDPSHTLNAGSPHPPPFPVSPIKRNDNSNSISAAEKEVLDEAKGRLILPKYMRPSPEERLTMMKEAMQRKKAALFLLASAQGDIETHSAYMIEDWGLEETIRFYDAHNGIEDDNTVVGRFIKAVSHISLGPDVW